MLSEEYFKNILHKNRYINIFWVYIREHILYDRTSFKNNQTCTFLLKENTSQVCNYIKTTFCWSMCQHFLRRFYTNRTGLSIYHDITWYHILKKSLISRCRYWRKICHQYHEQIPWHTKWQLGHNKFIISVLHYVEEMLSYIKEYIFNHLLMQRLQRWLKCFLMEKGDPIILYSQYNGWWLWPDTVRSLCILSHGTFLTYIEIGMS